MKLRTGALAALFGTAAVLAAEEKLPPRHCVAELRAARIAGMNGDFAAELAGLRRTVESCPGEPEPLVALLAYSARHPLSATDLATINEALLARVTTGGDELPITVLQQIAAEPQLDPSIKTAVFELIGRRVATTPDPAALRLLATLLLRQGDSAAAVETLERLHRIDPSPTTLWTLAELYAKLERWQELARLLDENAGSHDHALKLLHIEALGRAGRDAETLAAIERLAGEIVTDAGPRKDELIGLLLSAAWNLRDAGDDEAAEAMFRKALTHDPVNPYLREVLTLLYGTEEEIAKLGAAHEQRLAAVTDPHVLLEAGTDKLAAGDAAGAYDLLARAAPAIATEAAWNNLGTAAFRLERWAEAADAFDQALAINPARAGTQFFRGHALVQMRRFDEAIVALVRSLELNPDRPMAHFDLALAYQETGQAELAAKHRKIYENAAQAQP